MKYLVKIVPKITSKDEQAHRKKSYPHAHKLGNIAEKDLVGKKQFKFVLSKCRELPKGHWAGTHTEDNQIHISKEFLDLIPAKKRKSVKKQLETHEIAEHLVMSKKSRRNRK